MSSTPGGILGAGTLVANKVAATGIFLEDAAAPSLNVAHQWVGGTVNLSAGTNPAQSFNVLPVAVGNTQVFTGPNATFSNTLTVPGTSTLGTANVTTALNVIGNASVTGNFLSTGSSTIGNVLNVGNTVNVPVLHANTITSSSVSTTGPMSNVYIETTTSLSSQSSALYLAPAWRLKAVSSGGLAFQSFYNGQWNNVSVLAPTGVSLSIANLTSPTT